MKSFKTYIFENKIQSLVSDYFKKDSQDKKKTIKTLRNMVNSDKYRDNIANYMLDHGANANDFAEIGLTEESGSPGTVTANIPNPVDTAQGPMGGTSATIDEECSCGCNECEEEQEQFMGYPVFDVPCDVHSNFMKGKNRYHRWSQYLNMDDEGCRKVYNYAKTKSPTKIILRNRLGAMIHVTPKNYH